MTDRTYTGQHPPRHCPQCGPGVTICCSRVSHEDGSHDGPTTCQACCGCRYARQLRAMLRNERDSLYCAVRQGRQGLHTKQRLAALEARLAEVIKVVGR